MFGRVANARRPLLVLGFMFAVPALVCTILTLIWNHHEGNVLEFSRIDTREKADVILVFGAAIAGHGQPGALLRARINHALALANNGYASNFILTGGVGWGPPAESVVMKRILSEHGIPESRILFETTSHTTREQVEFAVQMMQHHGWKRVLAVSDPFHLYRITRYFEDSGITVLPSPSREIRFTTDEQEEYVRAEVLKLLAWLLLDY
ncbi:MAG TPA: YdcF family protein [Spirochaetota bacterium]|nr:YdcF family protein [Spirochaetota bacterium]HPH03023.1 YdcF family protein [Spirochaetota bacterium]HPN82744.1 YdcF family protein [Spirochaetota bacterium]